MDMADNTLTPQGVADKERALIPMLGFNTRSQNDVLSCFQIIAEIVKLLYTCACKRTGALV